MIGNRRNPPRNHFPIRRGAPARPSALPVAHASLPNRASGASRYSGDLGLRVTVRLPVHIGSGQFILDDKEQAVKDVARLRGVPVLPGSSIKGMCRQVYELLTKSPQAPGKKDRGARFPRERIETFRKPKPKQAIQFLSPAAALFGCLGYQGRVSFDDAIPVTDVTLERKMISTAYPPQHATRDVYKFYGDLPATASQPRRIVAFAIPQGTVLETRLRLRNVTESEIGDVLVCLGVDRFAPRIGGAKYDALGMVIFDVRSVRLHQGLLSTPESFDDTAIVASRVQSWLAASPLRTSAHAELDELAAKLPQPRKRAD